ncbi:hypothetical protein BJD16_21000 [Aeromonas sobria]|uniref:Integrase DNA-binding domain-containing protein n=2 Tax=Aeromonas sobria TaxID=646 RepID=A0A1S2CJM2_AERSO|nr:hypothetical protein BJD16_21000 [Aeromonas sobria]
MINFGSWPEMSLADAREKRSEAKTLLQQNIDPQHHRDEQVPTALSLSEHTFEAVAKRWFDVKRPSCQRRPKTDPLWLISPIEK